MSDFEDTLDSATVAGSASEEMIHAAEEQLGLKFPLEYRTFLKKYGAAMGTGFEIAGVFVDEGDGPPLWRDVVKATERFRRSVNGIFPDTLISISDDGGGVAFYVVANDQDEAGCPVIAYGPGVDGKTVANSFEEFVVKMARDQLAIY